MNTIGKISIYIINLAIVLSMAALTAVVFSNVVLRYGFDTGIGVTVEVSRYLFIWIIFLGSIVAMKDNEHIAADILKDYLPIIPRNILFIIINLIMLLCSVLILIGCWERMLVDMSNHTPIAGIPVGVLFMAGCAAGVGMGSICIIRIIRIALNITGSEYNYEN